MLSTKTTILTTNRNYGIDLLRIFSMFMVLILHILGHGGIIKATDKLSQQYIAAWFLEICAYCAVNCYGLISGYVGINSKHRYTNIVLLWLQVVLINVVTTTIFFISSPQETGLSSLLLAFFPVYKRKYWFFSSYFGLFILMPLINSAIHKLNRKQALLICFSIILQFSILPTFALSDPFDINSGYSTLWLILLYFLGACIHKFDLPNSISTSRLFLCYGICVILSLTCKLLLDINPYPFVGNFIMPDTLIQYSSPTILLCGIALLSIFSRIKIRSKMHITVINIFAPVAFGVYLIHEHSGVRSTLFRLGIWNKIAQLHPLLLIVSVLASAAILFIVCSAIDMLRLNLFRKLRIKERIAKLEEKYLGNIWSISQSDGD